MIDGILMGDDERKRLNRRQLLKAGAWAAPALVLATAAPAAANASPATANTLPAPAPAAALPTVTVDAVTLGNSGPRYDVSVGTRNNVASTASATVIATISVTPVGVGTWPDGTTTPRSVSAVVPVGGTATLAFPTFSRVNNAKDQAYYTITFTVNGVADAGLTRTGELKR